MKSTISPYCHFGMHAQGPGGRQQEEGELVVVGKERRNLSQLLN